MIMCVWIYMCRYMHVYAYTHMYTNICIYTYTHAFVFSWNQPGPGLYFSNKFESFFISRNFSSLKKKKVMVPPSVSSPPLEIFLFANSLSWNCLLCLLYFHSAYSFLCIFAVFWNDHYTWSSRNHIWSSEEMVLSNCVLIFF